MVLVSHLHAAFIVMVIYLFHVSRNLTSIYYAVLGLVLLCFSFSVFCNAKRIKLTPLVCVLFVFVILCWVYVTLISVSHSDVYGAELVGVIRFWAAIPLLAVAAVLSRTSIEVPMRIVSVFFVFAALSYVWQYYFGAIGWFAEASERAGGDRFASLAGSLTAYGVMVGVPTLAALFFFKGLARLLIFLVLTLGALMSLQKAALANVVIAVLFSAWLGMVRWKTLMMAFFTAMLIVVFLIGSGVQEWGGNVSRQLIGAVTFNTEISTDVSFFDSVWDRLTDLPSEALGFYMEHIVFGAGVFGGAGALGYPHYPMPHNGLVEVISIFGVLVGGFIDLLLLFMFFFSMIGLLLRCKVVGSEVGFLYSAYAIWFINYLFSGGGLFHPVGALIFWLVVFRILALGRDGRMHSNTPGSSCSAHGE